MKKEVIGDATLYCADNSKILHLMGTVDHCISDPPYSDYTHDKHLAGIVERNDLAFTSIQPADLINTLRGILRITRRWVILTCDWRHIGMIEQAGLPLIRFGIWVKPNGAPQFTGDRPGTGWEPVAILHNEGMKKWNGGGLPAVWTYNIDKGWHPTQKPLALIMKWINQFTDAGETVIDPFMGSGTTGEACVLQGRKFIGIEKEPHYFAAACQRIEDAQRQYGLRLK